MAETGQQRNASPFTDAKLKSVSKIQNNGPINLNCYGCNFLGLIPFGEGLLNKEFFCVFFSAENCV